MKQTIEFKKSLLLRRLGSLFIDFIIVFACFFVIDSLITTPIVEATTDYNEVYQQYFDYLAESELYIYNENGEIEKITSDYDRRLTNFFTKNGKLDIYEQKKNDSNYFIYDANLNIWTKKDEVKDEDLTAFYQNVYFNDALPLLEQQEIVMAMNNKLAGYNLMMVLINSSVSLILVFLVVPLIDPHHSTFGMKPFRMRLVNKNNGENISVLQVIFRFLILISIEILASIYTFGIPAIISIGMTVFTTNRQSLRDFLCGNYIVDITETGKKPLEKDKIYISYDDGKEDSNGK